jgi:ABC-2 type transport system ATP-binding protein
MGAMALPDRGLHVDRVSRRYGDVVALRDLSLQVAPGELFGFVGANGAGKTTTMRIVMGVLAADAGQVRWNGAPVDFETRRRFGYMPEERGLYPKMRVLEQLVYLAQLHGLRAEAGRRGAMQWLERLGLAERANDDVQKLSRGNQQRVQLAAALLYNPELLILDEPFAGLDPVAVDVMSDVLKERSREGIPVIFSSHQLEIVEELCDRVGIIQSGHMVAAGTVDELRQGGPRRYWVDASPNGWAKTIPGVTVVRRNGSETLIELADGTDDQAVLRAALAEGPVHEFRRDIPRLSELFRHVVGEPARA